MPEISIQKQEGSNSQQNFPENQTTQNNSNYSFKTDQNKLPGIKDLQTILQLPIQLLKISTEKIKVDKSTFLNNEYQNLQIIQNQKRNIQWFGYKNPQNVGISSKNQNDQNFIINQEDLVYYQAEPYFNKMLIQNQYDLSIQIENSQHSQQNQEPEITSEDKSIQTNIQKMNHVEVFPQISQLISKNKQNVDPNTIVKEFIINELKTNLIKGLKSNGVPFDHKLKLTQLDSSWLTKITMEFSKQINNFSGHYQQVYSLSYIEFQFIKQHGDNNKLEEFNFGQIGGWERKHQENVDQKKIYVLEKGDKLISVSLYQGTFFFPLVKFKSQRNNNQQFGYPEKATKEEVISIKDNQEIIGVFGLSGWVVDQLGFYLREFIEKKDK